MIADIGAHADALNAELTRAEDIVRGMMFKCRARVPLEDFPDRFLAFGKFDGRWGLALVDAEWLDFGLLSGGIHQRVAAAKAVPALVDALRLAAEAQALGIGHAIAQLRAYLDSLEGKEQAQ